MTDKLGPIVGIIAEWDEAELVNGSPLNLLPGFIRENTDIFSHGDLWERGKLILGSTCFWGRKEYFCSWICYTHHQGARQGERETVADVPHTTGRVKAHFSRDDQDFAVGLVQILHQLKVPYIKVWGPNNKYESFGFDKISPTDLLSRLEEFVPTPA